MCVWVGVGMRVCVRVCEFCVDVGVMFVRECV